MWKNHRSTECSVRFVERVFQPPLLGKGNSAIRSSVMFVPTIAIRSKTENISRATTQTSPSSPLQTRLIRFVVFLGCYCLLLVAKHFRYEANVTESLAKSTNKTTSDEQLSVITDESNEKDAICNEYSIESFRASGLHWTLSHGHKNINNVSLYSLGVDTVGIQIQLLEPVSQSQARNITNRQKLRQSYSWHLKQQQQKYLHKINPNGDNKSAPNYDNYLGCSNIDDVPHGTAIVVVQNFYCANLWHSVANLHGIWLLLKILDISPSEVTSILPSEYGTPFVTNHSMAKYQADLLWPLFVDTPYGSSSSNNSSRSQIEQKTNCFERIVWMETSNYRPGPYWTERFHKKDGNQYTDYEYCTPGTLYRKLHQQFYDEVQIAIDRTMPRAKYHDNHNTTTNITTTTVCYMSRRLRNSRLRYFSEKFEPIFEGRIDAWAKEQGQNRNFRFLRLEYDESVPLFHQVQQVQTCNVMFGPHGAGLGHMVWMRNDESHVVEFGGVDKCQQYYGPMSNWYRHHYTCFSELDGSDIRFIGDQMYDNINIELLLTTLEDILDDRERKIAAK